MIETKSPLIPAIFLKKTLRDPTIDVRSHHFSYYSWRVIWLGRAGQFVAWMVLSMMTIALLWLISGQPRLLLDILAGLWQVLWRLAIAIVVWLMFTAIGESFKN
jgi:hypothetical protein